MKYLLPLFISLFSLYTYTQLAIPLESTTSHALVIGISDYQDESLTDLEYADKSALAYAAYLKSKAGGSLVNKNIRLLLNEEATVGNMVASLDWLLETGKKGDKVIFYFSGYGNLQNLIPYNIPRTAIRGPSFPCQKLKNIATKIAFLKGIELVIIVDIYPPFASAENEILENRLSHIIDSLKSINDFVILPQHKWDFQSAGFHAINSKPLTYHLLDALIGKADYDKNREVSIIESKTYLHSQLKPAPVNRDLLYVYTDPINPIFSKVDKDILKQLEKDKNNQLPPIVKIDSEDFENSLLLKQNEAIRNLYQEFVIAIRLGNLLAPKDLSANDFFLQLVDQSSSKSLKNAAKRKFTAALQDESQQAINAYLKTDPSELQLRWAYSDKYAKFPLYLEKAASLLGEKHYLYKHVRAKQHYFEGVAIRLDNDKENRDTLLYKAALQKQLLSLDFEEQAAFTYNEIGLIYSRMGHYKKASNNFLNAIEYSPTWSIPYSNLCIVYRQLEGWDLAKSYCQQAIEIKSDNSAAHINMGIIYLQLKQYKKAEKYFKKSSVLFPESPDAFYNMACSKALRGKTAAANRWLEGALSRGFETYKHIQDDVDLESIRRSRKYQRLIKEYFPQAH